MRLFELCGTSDDETAKTIAVILSFFDPKRIWSFLDYVFKMSSEERREKRDSVATCCYVLGKIGQTRTEKALSYLKVFLSEDHMLRSPVSSALSNLWVLDTKTTARTIMRNWILNNGENDDLQEAGVKSTLYLANNAPELVSSFLSKVAVMEKDRKVAARAAQELIESISVSGTINKARVAPRARKKPRS